MQVLRAPSATPLFCAKSRRRVMRSRMVAARPTASLQEIVRTRGVFVPVSIAQDFATLTGVTLVTAALYAALAKRKPSNTKDKVILASSSAIFWYAGRYLFFGIEWGTASAIWLLDKLWPISASGQWKACPSDDPTLCNLPSIPFAQGQQALYSLSHAQDHDLHFAPVLRTVKTFVEQHPVILTSHLCFVLVAGLLWPLQDRSLREATRALHSIHVVKHIMGVPKAAASSNLLSDYIKTYVTILRIRTQETATVWGPFRQESYKRHKIIGKIVMASLLGAYATASVIALGLLGSDEWAEKATGLGFVANISLSVFSLFKGVIAAKQKDIPTHRQHVIRMIGLAYGVFPFKYLWLTLLSTTDVISGEWTYAASVWLSCITGVLVTERAFLGALPAEDAAKDRRLPVGASNKSE